MKKILFLVLIAFATMMTYAQTSPAKTVVIQTNGTCAQCKKIMMENVPQWAGVKSCSYDMNTAKVTITYDSRKTNPDVLRKQISGLGYNADNVKANTETRAKLPACCQKSNVQSQHHCGGCGGGCNHHH